MEGLVFSVYWLTRFRAVIRFLLSKKPSMNVWFTQIFLLNTRNIVSCHSQKMAV